MTTLEQGPTGPTGETLDYIGLAQKYNFSPDTFFGHTGFIGLEYLGGPTGFYFQIPGLTGTQFYFLGPEGSTGSNDPFSGLTGFNASEFLQLSKDYNFVASIHFGSSTGPSGSNYYHISKHIDLTNIKISMYYKHIINVVIDTSLNDASIILMAEIDECLAKINSEKVHHLGRLEDYLEIMSLINIVYDFKLQLNLQNLEEVAEIAERISELLESFNVKLETILNLISVEELLTIRQALGSVLRMLEAYENFSFIITNQMIVRGECMTGQVANILNNVYCNITNVFNHSTCVPCSAPIVCDNFADIQYKIDKFESYSVKLNEFAQSLGLECIPPEHQNPSLIDILCHEKKYKSNQMCDQNE
jgi:hypothetical protein